MDEIETVSSRGGGGTLLYGLNDYVRPDRVWCSDFFVLNVLNGVSISSLFVLNRVSLHLSGKSVHLNFVRIVQKKTNLYLFCSR